MQPSTPSNHQLLPYDTTLLDRVRDQWQLGDWQGLTALDAESLEHHPDRAKVALLVAAAHLQLGEAGTARQFVKLAQNWGCGKRLAAQVLIAGVYNTLGRIEMARGQNQKGLSRFKTAIATVLPNADQVLLGEARAVRETLQIGLLQQAVWITSLQFSSMKGIRSFDDAKLLVIESELGQISRKISKNQKRKLVVVNGMTRSGSTVAFNIVGDLFDACGTLYSKYYSKDFPSSKTIFDHVSQNEKISFLIKTHNTDESLVCLVEKFIGKFVYTKRNLYEVSASFMRMSKVKESPFYKEKNVTLPELLSMLDLQVAEYKKAIDLPCCLIVDAKDFSDLFLRQTVVKINNFLEFEVDDNSIDMIVKKRLQKSSAEYSENLGADRLTSLGHDRKTFFHKNHVVIGGTKVDDYLSFDWRSSIYEKFNHLINESGDFL
ncbi:hypothetical protein [Allochromatium vinosum]|uniref:hypothetical protein n=1 Tax=Allochromatium vinosum TaxID=1049 RepID=UPI0019053C44|nr:hypothetical protein [Allochromatium vinosum]